MTHVPRTRVIVALQISATLVLLFARASDAQIVATSFSELQGLVKPGETIRVTEVGGRKTKGKLGELSPTTLELLVRRTEFDGSERFVPRARLSETDVRQIVVERRDPPWRGTLIGLAAVGGPWALICSTGCIYGEPGGENFIRYMALITSGIAAGIGTAVDAAIVKKTTVYFGVASRRASATRLSPLRSQSGAGMQISVSF